MVKRFNVIPWSPPFCLQLLATIAIARHCRQTAQCAGARSGGCNLIRLVVIGRRARAGRGNRVVDAGRDELLVGVLVGRPGGVVGLRRQPDAAGGRCGQQRQGRNRPQENLRGGGRCPPCLAASQADGGLDLVGLLAVGVVDLDRDRVDQRENRPIAGRVLRGVDLGGERGMVGVVVDGPTGRANALVPGTAYITLDGNDWDC